MLHFFYHTPFTHCWHVRQGQTEVQYLAHVEWRSRGLNHHASWLVDDPLNLLSNRLEVFIIEITQSAHTCTVYVYVYLYVYVSWTNFTQSTDYTLFFIITYLLLYLCIFLFSIFVYIAL